LRGIVDGINVIDAAPGKTSTGSFSAAAVLAAHGHEPVLEVRCGDRSGTALAGDLLSAAAVGVRNLLILCGDEPRSREFQAKSVLGLDSQQAIALAHEIRHTGWLPSGRKVDPPPQFFIGAAEVLDVPTLSHSSARLLGKLEAGADFVQTQLCFDMQGARVCARRWREEGISERLAIIVGVAPIQSAESARWMNQNVPGMRVPEDVIERLKNARDEREEGHRICAEIIETLRATPGVAGAHVMALGRGPEAIAAVLELLPSGL
jgi:5,10-methylenetetrahydrofolate reductase